MKVIIDRVTPSKQTRFEVVMVGMSYQSSSLAHCDYSDQMRSYVDYRLHTANNVGLRIISVIQSPDDG
jgi:hypothetical protein